VHSINEQWNDSETECQCDQYEFVTATEKSGNTHICYYFNRRMECNLFS